ncbi:hypothetical protein ACFYR1_53010 [Streptomyces canus]|uniref:hypothetical protein n=1 Tax=Streptomyces canus TaxID=58343 RepID=UPI003677668E
MTHKFTVVGLDLSLTGSGIAYRDASTSTVKTRQKDGDHRLTQIEKAVQLAVGGEHLGLGPAVDLGPVVKMLVTAIR